MLVVDSGVWIDFFNDSPQPQVDILSDLMEAGNVRLVVPDLVLFEVLRGFRHQTDHRRASSLMEQFSLEATGGARLARIAAQHYRSLREKGITIRSSIDVLIATFCIEHDYALLHRDRDRDFDAFERLRGLRVWTA